MNTSKWYIKYYVNKAVFCSIVLCVLTLILGYPCLLLVMMLPDEQKVLLITVWVLVLMLSVMGLAITNCGEETYEAFKQCEGRPVRVMIFMRNHAPWYCDRIGYHYAIKVYYYNNTNSSDTLE